MSRGPDASIRLARALRRSATDVGGTIVANVDATVRWASATFVGSRHAISLKGMAFPAFDAWLARLSETELGVPGNIVVDLTITSKKIEGEHFDVALEALTLEVDLHPPLQPPVASRRSMPSVS